MSTDPEVDPPKLPLELPPELGPWPAMSPTVAIAGASGFVGRALARALAPDHGIIALGRSPPADPPKDKRASVLPFSWRRCDLFSLLDAERGLDGADVAVYLVHSMLPTSRLTQARFQDLDLICADNFARAARKAGVRRIVYLGGLIPPAGRRALSAHLASRLEVERTLAAHGVPLVALRASLVIGAGGSSFEMMVRLVERLPAMLCPAWTLTPTQPIALADVVRLLTFALDDPELAAGAYDIGGPDVLSYRDLMALTADRLRLRRRPMVPVPLFSPGLSRLWISLFTGASRALVAPLVQSLRHPMVAHDRRLQTRADVPGVPLVAAIDDALTARAIAASRGYAPTPDPPAEEPIRRLGRPAGDVRSVQRLALPAGHDASWIADEYLRWLPRHLRFLLHVDVTRGEGGDGHTPPILCRFRVPFLRRPLIELRFAPERSTPDRPLFYVTGGLLAHRDPSHGRLEFRELPDTKTVLAALHDYVPRLPFGIYVATQGLIHRLVMAAFGRHLRRLA